MVYSTKLYYTGEYTSPEGQRPCLPRLSEAEAEMDEETRDLQLLEEGLSPKAWKGLGL